MRTAFEYLVERIVSRRCVPLIGAGISMGARRRGAPWDGHHVKVMIDKVLAPTLMARITRTLGAPPDVRSARICVSCQAAFAEYHLALAATCNGTCMTCDLREARLSRALTKICEAFLWEHGGPNQESTYRKLVQTLEIEEFVELEPTPAHYYLAFLVREGLLSEVVTTNYDCNLERAYDARDCLPPASKMRSPGGLMSLFRYRRVKIIGASSAAPALIFTSRRQGCGNR
ncbi:hypothetical protein [Paraburkholderia sp. JPY419]|uniref:hypothetical protein n=1 Tax=Paraburkholderia sp. JPY419 TaxID=667660 RepID=UPI003D1BC734